MPRFFLFFSFNLLLLVVFSGCFPRKDMRHSHTVSALAHRSLFIKMPTNKKVFKNIGPQLYRIVWDHCERVGYDMHTRKEAESYSVELTIVSLEIPSRFVSPDIVPYSNNLRLQVFFELKDSADHVLVRRPFFVSRWVSRPQDPVFEELYIEHELEKMCQRLAPGIELTIRKVLSGKAVL